MCDKEQTETSVKPEVQQWNRTLYDDSSGNTNVTIYVGGFKDAAAALEWTEQVGKTLNVKPKEE